jgi:hypothetical protein
VDAVNSDEASGVVKEKDVGAEPGKAKPEVRAEEHQRLPLEPAGEPEGPKGSPGKPVGEGDIDALGLSLPAGERVRANGSSLALPFPSFLVAAADWLRPCCLAAFELFPVKVEDLTVADLDERVRAERAERGSAART